MLFWSWSCKQRSWSCYFGLGLNVIHRDQSISSLGHYKDDTSVMRHRARMAGARNCSSCYSKHMFITRSLKKSDNVLVQSPLNCDMCTASPLFHRWRNLLLPARRRPQGLVIIGVCLCALFLSARYLKNGFMGHHQIWWVGAGGEPLEQVQFWC